MSRLKECVCVYGDLSVLVGDLQQQGQAAVVKVVVERDERPVHAAF